MDHRRQRRRRCARFPGTPLPPLGRRDRLWPGIRWIEDGAARSRPQHLPPVGYCGGLRGGGPGDFYKVVLASKAKEAGLWSGLFCCLQLCCLRLCYLSGGYSERAVTALPHLFLNGCRGRESRNRLADGLVVGEEVPRLLLKIGIPDRADAGIVPADHIIAGFRSAHVLRDG